MPLGGLLALTLCSLVVALSSHPKSTFESFVEESAFVEKAVESPTGNQWLRFYKTGFVLNTGGPPGDYNERFTEKGKSLIIHLPQGDEAYVRDGNHLIRLRDKVRFLNPDDYNKDYGR